MPSNPRSSNGTDANPNEIKYLAAKRERVTIENGFWPGERLRGEVEELRRLLVEAERVGRSRVAMSGAERMRRLRARRRSQ